MGHRTKGSKIYVTEANGDILFSYIINPLQLWCQCHGTSREREQMICTHLEYYLSVQGVPKSYFPVLSVPRVRVKIKGMNFDQIIDYCHQFLMNEEVGHCVICHEIYGSQPLHQCPQCRELLHSSCHNRWQSTGTKCQPKACPRCKYIKDLPKPKDEDEWPILT